MAPETLFSGCTKEAVNLIVLKSFDIGVHVYRLLTIDQEVMSNFNFSRALGSAKLGKIISMTYQSAIQFPNCSVFESRKFYIWYKICLIYYDTLHIEWL